MTNATLTIDGSMGEGGGQVLRAALALSMALGTPFHMTNIRANRPKPGLKRQHLTCVRAAQALCGAEVKGDVMHSTELSFMPGPVQAGAQTFHVGSGGSVTLVLQALVPALLRGGTPSRLTVTGGTHVPYAPPFEFMRDTLFAHLETMGPKLAATMDRIGYMDVGGGRVTVDITPASNLTPYHDQIPGVLEDARAAIYRQNIPMDMIEREAEVLQSRAYAELGLACRSIHVEDGSPEGIPAEGCGNMVLVTLRHGRHATVFGECGWKGSNAEKVAAQACKRAMAFVRAGLPVEAHLADQLLVPMALAGGGCFVTERVTPHAHTCLEVIRLFTGMRATLAAEGRCSRLTLE